MCKEDEFLVNIQSLVWITQAGLIVVDLYRQHHGMVRSVSLSAASFLNNILPQLSFNTHISGVEWNRKLAWRP